MSSTEGTLDISGLANIFDASESQLRHQLDADLTSVRYPQAGMRVALGKRAALALVYRGEFQLKLDLKANLHGSISELTTAYYGLETHSVNNFLPQQLVVGGSWLPLDDLRANLDVTWINWSAYVAPVATLDVKLDIPPPQGGWPAGVRPPTVPAQVPILPIAMHDRIVPHVGVEWRAVARRAWEGFLRGGYEYAKSPIPPQTGATNYVDRDRQSFSFGAGVRLKEPCEPGRIASEPVHSCESARVLRGDVRLDLHAQLSELKDGVTTKTSAADLVGDYTAIGHIWNVGATLAVGF
jgi:long-chain fatty acid transport protein